MPSTPSSYTDRMAIAARTLEGIRTQVVSIAHRSARHGYDANPASRTGNADALQRVRRVIGRIWLNGIIGAGLTQQGANAPLQLGFLAQVRNALREAPMHLRFADNDTRMVDTRPGYSGSRSQHARLMEMAQFIQIAVNGIRRAATGMRRSGAASAARTERQQHERRVAQARAQREARQAQAQARRETRERETLRNLVARLTHTERSLRTRLEAAAQACGQQRVVGQQYNDAARRLRAAQQRLQALGGLFAQPLSGMRRIHSLGCATCD
jgi:hypothetical protein